MLKSLYIRNFAIIDALDLELHQGLSTLTGETGAGKSVIIDAIELALGQRASQDVIKVGAEKAEIHIEFDIHAILEAQEFLETHDLNPQEGCLIRRIIYRDGRSKSMVNGIPVTQQMLRQLSESLINIHGQHEFQNLLKSEYQRQLVDQLTGRMDLVDQLHEFYRRWVSLHQELQELTAGQGDTESKADFLRYQIQEFEQLNLQENELEALIQEHKELSHREAIIQACQEALTLLDSEGDSAFTVLQALSQAKQALANVEVFYPALTQSRGVLEGLMTQTGELSKDLSRGIHALNTDPERLNALEKRLTAIHDLARKHRVEAKDLLSTYQSLCSTLNTLTHSAERIETIQKQLNQIEFDYFVCAKDLSKQRQKAAKQLTALVTQHIKSLGMPHGEFQVTLQSYPEKRVSPEGLEKILFQVTTNPGHPPKPLTLVASGGELSRICLAIHMITAKQEQVPTLIFDEIDAGVGGATAEMIGRLLRELGKMTQVFCITHLPQVASCGHHHLRVDKTIENAATQISIQYLDIPQKIQEIARMLGGLTITSQTLAHAKEMVESQHSHFCCHSRESGNL